MGMYLYIYEKRYLYMISIQMWSHLIMLSYHYLSLCHIIYYDITFNMIYWYVGFVLKFQLNHFCIHCPQISMHAHTLVAISSPLRKGCEFWVHGGDFTAFEIISRSTKEIDEKYSKLVQVSSKHGRNILSIQKDPKRYCWWKKSCTQLRLIAYPCKNPIIYDGFGIHPRSSGWPWDFWLPSTVSQHPRELALL